MNNNLFLFFEGWEDEKGIYDFLMLDSLVIFKYMLGKVSIIL